jgi:hypothetical protein
MGESGEFRLAESGETVAVADVVAISEAVAKRELRAEAVAFAAAHGANAYTHFILKHGRRPSRKQAAAMGRLLGKRVRASDGSMQPSRSKSERKQRSQARQILKDDARIDAELSRLCDALLFLAQNECDPSLLITRATPLEKQEITSNIAKAVESLQRFAHCWGYHVQIGFFEPGCGASERNEQAGRAGLRLIRCRD